MPKKPDILTTYDPGEASDYGAPRSINQFFKCVEGDPTNPIVCQTANRLDYDIADEIDFMLDLLVEISAKAPLQSIYQALYEYLESTGIEMPPKRQNVSEQFL